MSNVVEGNFTQKKEVVFKCVKCEGQSFWLDYEGSVTCRVCKVKQAPPPDWVNRILENQKLADDS